MRFPCCGDAAGGNRHHWTTSGHPANQTLTGPAQAAVACRRRYRCAIRHREIINYLILNIFFYWHDNCAYLDAEADCHCGLLQGSRAQANFAAEFFNPEERVIMNVKLTTGAILIGALSLPVAGLAAETGPGPASPDKQRSSATTVIKDSMITAKIKTAMAKDKQVSALNIRVDTDDRGVVTLSGKAKSQAEADKAVALARSVEGVVSVQNNIQVGTM
jgi:hyperosmotically inducible protein